MKSINTSKYHEIKKAGRRDIIVRSFCWLLIMPAVFMQSAVAAGTSTVVASVDAASYPSLQAAFDALPESGGVVTLPPGRFEIGQPLVLNRGDVRIRGAGPSSHIVNTNREGQPAILIQPAGFTNNPRLRLWRVQIGDFRISGNTNSGDGLQARGVNEIYIHGLSVDHNGGNGISLLQCEEDPRVVDSILTYNGNTGLNLEGDHDIVVKANQFEENRDALRCVDGFNLCMSGNNIDDHLRHGIIIENTYGSVVSGNMIEECNGTAVILDRDCYGITVSANVIAHHLGGGVHLQDAWGCGISANTFVLVHSNSICVSSNSGRLAITGNAFCNSYIGNGKDNRPARSPRPMGRDEGTGILLQSASDVVISGNQFSGLSGQAVIGEGICERILVAGNLVTDYGRKLKDKRPAFAFEKASGGILKDNIVAEAP